MGACSPIPWSSRRSRPTWSTSCTTTSTSPPQLRDALPPRAKPLATPAAAALRDVFARGAQRVLASPQAQTAWRAANRRAQSQLVKLLDGGGGALTTTNGAVVLNLHPIVERVAGRVGGGGALPASAGTIVLLRSDQLKLAQDATQALKQIAIILVPLVLLIFVLAIWVAPDRRRAVRNVAIAILVSGLVLVFVRRVLGDQLIDRLVKDTTIRPADPPCLVDRHGPAAARDHVDPVRRHRRADRRVGRRPRCARDRRCEGRWPGSCETIARGSRSRQSSSCCSSGRPHRRRGTGSPWSVSHCSRWSGSRRSGARPPASSRTPCPGRSRCRRAFPETAAQPPTGDARGRPPRPARTARRASHAGRAERRGVRPREGSGARR